MANKTRLKHMGRRGLSFFLALVMCISLVQITAFAETTAQEQAKEQIQGGTNPVYYEYDESIGDFKEDPVRSDTNTSAGGKVEVSKKISATGVENEFKIELEVSTKQKVEHTEASPDSAVVLVIDVSRSMGHGRLTKAKEAAMKFAENYAKDANGAKRMITLVAFSKDAEKKYSWVDAATLDFSKDMFGADYQKDWGGNYKNPLLQAINQLRAGGGTNTEGGFQLAYNLLNEPKTNPESKISGIKNTYVVALTDGKPSNYIVKDHYSLVKIIGADLSKDEQDNQKVNVPAANVAKKITGVTGNGPNDNPAKLYTICYGASNDYIYGKNNDNGEPVTVSAWLTSIATQNFDNKDSDDVTIAFDKIIKTIKSLTEAWVVTDPMGSDLILFDQEKSGVAVDNSAAVKNYDTATKTLYWNLKNAVVDEVTGSGDNTTYTYKMEYYVTLNTKDANFKDKVNNEAVWYKTNGRTTLEYCFKKTENGVETIVDEAGNPVDMTTYKNPIIDFNVPAVRGYLGSFSFTKKAAGAPNLTFGSAASDVANATFQVKDLAGNEVMKRSTTNSIVTFSGLPSGLADGQDYNYKMKETAVTGDKFQVNNEEYTVSVRYGRTVVKKADGTTVYDSQLSSNDMEVFNNWDPKKVTLTITKTWNDSAETANRPNSITVKLMQVVDKRDGEDDDTAEDIEVQTITINKPASDTGNTWTIQVANIPTHKTDCDEGIGYYLTEVKAAGYEGTVTTDFTVSGTTATAAISNTRKDYDDIEVTKSWVTVGGYETPARVQLLRTGGGEVKQAYGSSAELNSANGWTHVFENVPTIDGTNSYTYEVVELKDNGDKVTNGGTITLNGRDYTVYISGYDVTNVLTQGNAASISGTKTWKIKDYKGTPTAVITLTGKVGSDVVVTDTANVTYPATSYSFPKAGETLPKYAYKVGGTWQTTASAAATEVQEITYTVEETYTGDALIEPEQKGNNFTNTLTDTVDVKVTKVWRDSNNEYGTRPSKVTINLLRDNKPFDSVDLEATGENGTWTKRDREYVFEGLDRYDSEGKEYTYTVQEETVSKYNASVSADTDNTKNYAYTVTNTLEGNESTKTSVSVQKTWLDGLTAAERAEKNIQTTITLTGTNGVSQTVVLPREENGAYNNYYTFDKLPLYHDGAKVVYTVQESTVTGYNGGNAADAMAENSYYEFKNVVDQYNSVEVSGTKTWLWNGADETATARLTLKSDLAEDGVFAAVEGAEAKLISKRVTTYSWTGLPKYAYKVGSTWQSTYSAAATEVRIIDYRVEEAADGFTDAATPEGGQYDLTNTFNQTWISLTGTKTWNDGGDEASRPESIKVALYQSGKAEPYAVVNVTKEDGWSYTFGKDAAGNDTLPKYSSYGQEYTYTVRELDGDTPISNNGTFGKYKVTYTGNDITNSLSSIETDKANVTVSKIWIGPANDEITVTVTRESNNVTDANFSESVTLKKDKNWSETLWDLPARDSKGYPYTYKMTEDDVTNGVYSWDGHNYDVRYSDNKLTVYNTVQQESNVTVSGTKLWSGSEPNGKIEVQLYVTKNGTPESMGDNYKVELSKENGWSYKWENLDRYYLADTDKDGIIDTDGHELVYSVKEVGETGGRIKLGDAHYAVTYPEGTYDIQNTWTSTDSYGYQVDRYYTEIIDGVRQSAKYETSGFITGKEAQRITVDADDYTAYGGKTYTFISADLDGTAVTDAGNAFTWTLDEANHTYILKLYYERTEKTPDPDPDTGDDDVDIFVSKVWKDDGSDLRPDSISVQLYRNGKAYGDEVTLSENNNWRYTWSGLKDSYTWTVEEVDVPDGYVSESSRVGNRWIITNTLEGTEIKEPETPATALPDTDVPTSDDTGVDLPEPEVPKADAPKTGDAAGLWAMAAAVSGMGLVWLAISGKKRKEEDA